MKTTSKILLIAMTLFIVNSSSVFAKGSSSDGTLFGVTAGLNLASVGNLPSGSMLPSPSMIVGFHVGGYADMSIANNIYFQPGVIYSSMGAKFSENGASATFNFGYIQIPLNFSYRLESGLNFNIDPYIGINLTAKETDNDGAGNSTTTDLKNPPAPETSNINSVDFGVGFGVGYMLSSGLGFKAAYSLGLGDVEKSQAATMYSPAQAASITNNVIMISVLYEFGKK